MNQHLLCSGNLVFEFQCGEVNAFGEVRNINPGSTIVTAEGSFINHCTKQVGHDDLSCAHLIRNVIVK